VVSSFLCVRVTLLLSLLRSLWLLSSESVWLSAVFRNTERIPSSGISSARLQTNQTQMKHKSERIDKGRRVVIRSSGISTPPKGVAKFRKMVDSKEDNHPTVQSQATHNTNSYVQPPPPPPPAPCPFQHRKAEENSTTRGWMYLDVSQTTHNSLSLSLYYL